VRGLPVIPLDLPKRTGSFLTRPFRTRQLPPELLLQAARLYQDHSDSAASIYTAKPTYCIPGDGEELAVGVLISMPMESGRGASRWDLREVEDEERELPEVFLGVIACEVKYV
jgi:hypothetical protein